MKEKIRNNLHNLKEEIKQLCLQSKYKQEVKLVVVTKKQPIENLKILQELGVKDFAENRLEELEAKAPLFPNICWHFIGHIQSRKLKKILPFTKLIHSIDSLKLIEKIDLLSSQLNRKSEFLLQINLTREKQKHGFLEEEIPQAIELCKQKKHIICSGFMAMTKKDQILLDKRKIFAMLYSLLFKWKQFYCDLKNISIGMSQDYNLAILEGSNIVRIGSKIFN